jgi:hypothetical protein
MARGFESKDVEFQQAEAERSPSKGRSLSPAEQQAEAQRRTTELALLRVRAEHEAASNPHHRQMLEQAIRALESALQKPNRRD